VRLQAEKIKPYLAMTGEITLRGQVLPVGGIKEKSAGGKTFGHKEIIMCWQNAKDVEKSINPSSRALNFTMLKQCNRF
jgi:ATP-dependent Lon protease